MSNVIVPQKRLRKIKPLVVAKPRSDVDWVRKAELAEPTGMGDILCIEGYFGRPFRSDPELVDDILCEFADMHDRMCQRFDEAEDGQKQYEVMCWNDLYRMLNLIPSTAGDQYGYVNSEDYRVDGIDFETKWIDQGEWVDCFREPFYYFRPKDGCGPDPCYLEY